jgi:hypothetical protein
MGDCGSCSRADVLSLMRCRNRSTTDAISNHPFAYNSVFCTNRPWGRYLLTRADVRILTTPSRRAISAVGNDDNMAIGRLELLDVGLTPGIDDAVLAREIKDRPSFSRLRGVRPTPFICLLAVSYLAATRRFSMPNTSKTRRVTSRRHRQREYLFQMIPSLAPEPSSCAHQFRRHTTALADAIASTLSVFRN